MAGSYGHVDPDKDGSWSLIENMGDAYECVEELLYLVRCFGDAQDIKEALNEFYRFKNGKADPNRVYPSAYGASLSDFGKAYLETQRVMGGADGR